MALADSKDRADYFAATSLATAYPLWTNHETNVPCIRADETVPAPVDRNGYGAGRLPMLRREQKRI